MACGGHSTQYDVAGFEYQELGALQEKNWLQGLQGVAIIAVWMAAVYYLTGRLNIPREFFAAGTDFGYWLLHRYSQRIPCRRRLGESEYVPGNPLMLQGWGTRIRNVDICAWLGTVLIRIIAGIENKGKGENISRG